LRELAKIVGPLNSRESPPSNSWLFGDFTRQVYLPFYRRKWKRSATMTNEDRIENHLLPAFDGYTLGDFTRDGLQSYLDGKAAAELSLSTVDHLRWDLKQIFDMAVAEGFLLRRGNRFLKPIHCLMSWRSSAEVHQNMKPVCSGILDVQD